ncbi:MAG: histidine--tRNA ligase [Nitrospirae bacterium]|nr:MAG: histidine--tRNA ligase [Nitrospirae bacterium 13_2_20CM_2_62_8]TLY40413.1 MAG: histidine--tRNA ligase [Nitrospirota bacterium]TLY42202.1 MAG: histidine--tRNA ligase [Nitrospirota bacterium]
MLRGIKGVKDILPDEIARWQLIEDMARRLSLSYGYQEIRVPVFEMTELFARSIGASTDIVEKEMYTFQDRDGTSLTLRPEATAGVVRAYIEHNLGGSAVSQKFFYLGPMFRHERPQAGRLRQFHQYGVEYFGMRSPLADVEVVSLLWRFLSGLGLPDLTLEINSLGDAADRPPYKAALLEFLKTREDRLCQNCRRRMGTNPLRVLDCKVPGCQTATEDAPRITDHLSAGSRRHFEDVQAGLRDLGIPFSLNSRLVRGLDYYTQTIFEVTSGRLGAQNAVAAGGRYDGLVEALGGASTPAVGFAVGLERVALVLPASAIPRPHSLIFVAAFGEQGVTAGTRVLDELRGLGLRADTDYRASTLKAHLRQADRLGAEYVVIIGDDEVTKGRLLVRNMRTKEQEELPLLTAARSLSSRLKIG